MLDSKNPMPSIHEKSTNQEMSNDADFGAFSAFSAAPPKLPLQMGKA